jgi:hypothetical protein
MERTPQNYANHAKVDELFHFFLMPVSLLTFVVAIWNLVRSPGFGSAWLVLLAIAFIVLLFRLRTYPLKVQDRVIRLEERMRLLEVLPDRLRARIPDLTESQLVALRFAPDSELPAMVDKALAEGLSNKQIKQAIGNWRPDYFRM